MKRYLLLRKNQQSGPHSKEQLESIGLLSSDLIWVEAESTVWKHPEEIEELKSLRRCDETPAQRTTPKNQHIFFSLPTGFMQNTGYLARGVAVLSAPETVIVSGHNIRAQQALTEEYRQPQIAYPCYRNRAFYRTQTTRVAAIFLGAIFGALIIKKTVDGSISATPGQTAVATPVLDREVEKLPGEDLKNALVTEIVPVYKPDRVKTAKRVNTKNQLKVKANDYKVGLFGGINGLQLTVFNTSSQVIDKAVVALDYLKPNGAVVQSEDVLFSSIRPRGAQTIAIPGSNRGVKVRYKILKVYTHNFKADLKEI